MAKGITFNVDEALDKCETVMAQLEAASAADRERASIGRLLTRLADRIMQVGIEGVEAPTADPMLVSAYEELGDEYTGSDPTDLAGELYAYGEKLNPMAGTSWSREEVATLVEQIKAMKTLNLLDDMQEERADKIIGSLGTIRKGVGGTGQRAPRQEAAPIEGRPYKRVRVATINGDTVAEQSADKINSSSNIKNAVVGALKKAGRELSDQEKKDVMDEVKKVVEKGEPTATILGILIVEPVPVTE